MNKIIVGIGEILWDMLPEGKRLGGAPANFAYHAAQSGLESYVISSVGEDNLGNEILQNLREKGLNYQIGKTIYPTGTVEVELDARGVPCYNIREQVAWDYITFTPEVEELARRTNAVCFGSLAQRNEVSRFTISRFLEVMPDGEGQYKIFDINLRQNYYTQELLLDSFHKCNVLKMNDDELLIIKQQFGYQEAEMQDICRALMADYYLKILILTCGTDGSYIFTPQSVSFYPTPRVEVQDTVGAGDSFTATFCAALLKGKSIPEAHRQAVETAAYVCSSNGAMPALPDSLKY